MRSFFVAEMRKVRAQAGHPRSGQVGFVADKIKETGLWLLEFPDGCVCPFKESELGDMDGQGIPCVKCIGEGRVTILSDPYQVNEGLAQDCAVHGRLYVQFLLG